MRLFIGRMIKWLGKNNLLNFICDKFYIKMLYYLFMGKCINFESPTTLNEKIQWSKLYDRNPLYTVLTDKIKVKEFVAMTIGGQYVIPLIGIFERFEYVKYNELPQQFVIKCNHDSGSCIVCKDKKIFDINYAKKKINKHLNINYFYSGREWAYKNINPKIIIEEYIEDSYSKDLKDYKFYCFGDVVDCVLVCVGRNNGKPKFYFFDREWNLKRYNKLGKQAPDDFTLPKPENIDEMFEIARTLSVASGAPFLRVDLYNVNGKIYFGELTLYPDCGMDRNRLPETDEYFGSLVDLSKVHNAKLESVRSI